MHYLFKSTGVSYLTYYKLFGIFMKHTSLATITIGLCLHLASGAHAQSTVTWGVSAGMNKYTEANMKLVGPEIGLHARGVNVFPNTNWVLEGDVLLGRQKYTSTSTGSMRNVGNVETRWRVMGDVDWSGREAQTWLTQVAQTPRLAEPAPASPHWPASTLKR